MKSTGITEYTRDVLLTPNLLVVLFVCSLLSKTPTPTHRHTNEPQKKPTDYHAKYTQTLKLLLHELLRMQMYVYNDFKRSISAGSPKEFNCLGAHAYTRNRSHQSAVLQFSLSLILGLTQFACVLSFPALALRAFAVLTPRQVLF